MKRFFLPSVNQVEVSSGQNHNSLMTTGFYAVSWIGDNAPHHQLLSRIAISQQCALILIDPLKHVLNCIFILRKSFSGIDSKPWPVEVQSAAKCHFHTAKIVFKHQNGRNSCKARPIGQTWFRCAKISFGFNHCKAMMLPSFAVKGKVLSWT